VGRRVGCYPIGDEHVDEEKKVMKNFLRDMW
jgi:hypothetical protein